MIVSLWRSQLGASFHDGCFAPSPRSSEALSADTCPARQCPVASEMASQPWGFLRGRGVQMQVRAGMAFSRLGSRPQAILRRFP